MARSLPLSDPAPSPSSRVGSTPAPAATLAGTVQVFDPAMCCPTGVCGPGVDPALLQITRDLRWLTAHGVTVQRFGLAQEPQAFVENARVAGLMQEFGDGALPAVLVNDTVLAHGRYPSRDELVVALSAATAPSVRTLTVQDTAGGGCTSGSGCC